MHARVAGGGGARGHGHACTTTHQSSDDLIYVGDDDELVASAVVSLFPLSIRAGNHSGMHAVAQKSDRRCFISWPDFTTGRESMAVPSRRLRFARASCHMILSLADSRRRGFFLGCSVACLAGMEPILAYG